MGETGDEVTVNVEKNEVNPNISPVNLTHVDGAGRRKDVAGRRKIRLFSATSCDV